MWDGAVWPGVLSLALGGLRCASGVMGCAVLGPVTPFSYVQYLVGSKI